MGSGTHWSKIDGFPGIHGTNGPHANGATDSKQWFIGIECEISYSVNQVAMSAREYHAESAHKQITTSQLTVPFA